MDNRNLVASIIVALCGGGAITALLTTLGQRRKVGADATAVVTAAARELVDPLRRELAAERRDHAAEIELERKKVKEVRRELEAAMREAKALRRELADARAENDRYRKRIADLEARE